MCWPVYSFYNCTNFSNFIFAIKQGGSDKTLDVHSVPSCKKRSYKKRLVDMATFKKRQLVEIDMVKKRISYTKYIVKIWWKETVNFYNEICNSRCQESS